MSMDREAYRLANEIKTELHAEGEFLAECPGEEEMKQYKSDILQEIKKEKRGRKIRRGLAAAACGALILAVGGTFFGEEVHAALQQMKWSMNSALGLSDDLAEYSEVIHTSKVDQGYVLTLQEVVIAEDEVVVNCTFEREDGAQMGGLDLPDGTLYINGKRAGMSGTGCGLMLDDASTRLGLIENYHLFGENGLDLSKENEFRLVYEQMNHEDGGSGTWEFAFTASGADLIADTRQVEFEQTFELPDGVGLTLTGLSSNALEQRIFYDLSGETSWMPMVKAEDSDGNQVKFGMIYQDKSGGYMVNQEIAQDGRLCKTAKSVKLTLYVQKAAKSVEEVTEEYMQIGEPFVVEL